jgi:predicted RNase H-like nuclease (RuvC/YqgF family)
MMIKLRFAVTADSESRKEDLKRIQELTHEISSRDAEIMKCQKQTAELQRKLHELHGELLLREDNYNKTFANGGVGMHVLNVSQAMNAEKELIDWMLKATPPGKRNKPKESRLKHM